MPPCQKIQKIRYKLGLICAMVLAQLKLGARYQLSVAGGRILAELQLRIYWHQVRWMKCKIGFRLALVGYVLAIARS